MAKRVLSLLLALVMALSLCVPAFAAEAPVDEADEVGAEAVEEVVDEAAAEPEAEPEVASVDEPATIATGEISPYAVEWLNDVLTKAAPFKARVDAGELYVYSATYVTTVTAGEKRADAFDKAYAEAERCQKAINGEETGADVTETNVTDAATALEAFLPEDVTELPTAGTRLTSALTTGMKNAVKDAAALATFIQGAGITDDTITEANLKDKDLKGVAAKHDDAYVAAVKAIVEAADAFNKKVKAETATYADFASLEAKVLALKEMKDPDLTLANAQKLLAAIKAVEKVARDEDGDKYVDFADVQSAATSAKDYLELNGDELNTAISANGFKSTTTYANYKQALASLTLTEIDMTVSVELSVDAGMAAITATLTKDENNKTANTAYYYSYTIDGKTLYTTADETVLCDAKHPLGGGAGDTDFAEFGKATNGKQSATVKLKNAATAPKTAAEKVEATFAPNTTVAITVYVKNDTYPDKYDVVATDSITTPKDSYTGAKIALDEETGDPEVEVTYPAGSFKRDGTDNMKLDNDTPTTPGTAISIAVTFDAEVKEADDAHLALVGSNNSIVKDADGNEAKSAEAIKDTSNGSLSLGDWEDKLTTTGMKIQLLTKGESGKEPVVHDGGEAAVEFDALSKWASFKDAKKYLEDAQDLSKDDYVIDPANLGSYKTLDDAWAQLQTNIDELAALIAAADSKVNSKYEQDLVLDAITKVATVYGYLKLNDELDLVDLIDALLAADEATGNKGTQISDDKLNKNEAGEYIYTHASWEAFKKAYNAALEIKDASSGKKQSEIDKATADLIEATEGLVKFGEADPTELKAAIAAAKALKEEDYTEESWADADLAKAIADAEAVANNENATQAQYDAALRSLEAAVAKLVEAEPEEPELKEGWNLIEGEYYYCKDGKMVKSDWVKSKGLWYHMGADGTMDTGFIHIVDDWGDGWYYLEPSNAKGTQGRMRTGWKEINDATAGHWGWFETRSNGHQGMCTYTTNQGDYKDYKPVK